MNVEHNAFASRTTPLLAAEMQYYRVPREHWELMLARMRQLGANAISTYVMWGWHCPAPGVFDFSGQTHPARDLLGFIHLVQEMGFELILKPGPFIDAEVLGGGIPSWFLAQHPEAHALRADGREWHHSDSNQARCTYLHPVYQQHVQEWYAQFSRAALAHQWPGGPVVALQVDNETPGDGMIASDAGEGADSRFRGDYNPYVLQTLWPGWLEERYGNPQALAEAYELPGAGFDLELPRRWEEPQTLGAVRRWMDVARFEEYLHAEGVSVFAGMLRGLGWQVPLFHDLLSMPWEASGILTSMPGLAGAVDWLGYNVYAEEIGEAIVDYSGYALDFPEYVHHAIWRPLLMKSYHPEFPAFIPEISAAGDFYFQAPFVGGLEATSIYVGLQSNPEPAEVGGYPSWGMEAPVRPDGSLRLRAWNAKSPFTYLQGFASDFAGSGFLGEVYIGYTHIAELAAKWAFRLQEARRDQPAGMLNFPTFQLGALSAAQSQRIAQQLVRAHIQFGVLDVDACPLDKCPLLVMPASAILARAAQEKLAAYLRRGGRLVWLGGPLPEYDENLLPCDLLARSAAQSSGCVCLEHPPADWAALLGVLGAQSRFAWADHPDVDVSARRTSAGGLLLAVANRSSSTYNGVIHLARPQASALRGWSRHEAAGWESLPMWGTPAGEETEPTIQVRLAGPHVGFIALQRGRLHAAILHAAQGGLVEFEGESIAVERGSVCAARFDDWLIITAPVDTRVTWVNADGWPGLQCWRMHINGGMESARLNTHGHTLGLDYETEVGARETEAYLIGPAGTPLPPGLLPAFRTRLARVRLCLERAARLAEGIDQRLGSARPEWADPIRAAVPALHQTAAGLRSVEEQARLTPEDFLQALQAAAGSLGNYAYALLGPLRAVRAASAAGTLDAQEEWLITALGQLAGALDAAGLWGE